MAKDDNESAKPDSISLGDAERRLSNALSGDGILKFDEPIGRFTRKRSAKDAFAGHAAETTTDRTIRLSVLRDLLINAAQSNRNEISLTINNAEFIPDELIEFLKTEIQVHNVKISLIFSKCIFRSGLILSNMNIPILGLYGCRFDDGICLSKCTVGLLRCAASLGMDAQIFDCDFGGKFELTGCDVEELYIWDSCFRDGVDITSTKISRTTQWVGIEATASRDAIINFYEFEGRALYWKDCKIANPVTLSNLNVTNLGFVDCSIARGDESTAADLNLTNSTIHENIHFTGLLFGFPEITDPQSAECDDVDETVQVKRNEIALTRISVGGNLVFGNLRARADFSLRFSQVAGIVSFDDCTIEQNSLILDDTRIDGSLWFNDTQVNAGPYNDGARASLVLRRVSVANQISISGKGAASKTKSRFGSTCCLLRIEARFLDIEDTVFLAGQDYIALCLKDADISQSAIIRDVEAQGVVDLSGSEIARDLTLQNVSLDVPFTTFERAAPPYAVDRDGQYRARDLSLSAFNLLVGRTLDITGVRYKGNAGMVDMRHARVGLLADDVKKSWPRDEAGGKLDLNGFHYERLALDRHSSDSSALPFETRRDWLSRQFVSERPSAADFKPQPYEQLARVFRDHGYAYSATQIAIAKRDLQQRCRVDRGLERAFNSLLKLTSNYGYSPRRAISWLLGWIVLGTVLAAGLRAFDKIDVRSADVPDTANFHPFVFAVDSIEPFLDLGQTESFRVLSPWLAVAWGSYSIIGLLLLSVALLTLSGVLRSD